MSASVESPTTYHRLDNGLTVLMQPMPSLRTAAFAFCLPAGVQWEPDGLSGLAGLTCEMVQRGAGPYSSRELVAVLDNLGVERAAGATTAHTSYSAAMPAENLQETLRVYAEQLRRPHLPANQLEDARNLALQELCGIEDEPTQRILKQLKLRHYGARLGRSAHGDRDGLEAITPTAIREFFENHYQPAESILAIAGRFDTDQVLTTLEAAFSDWQPQRRPEPIPLPRQPEVYDHFEHPSQQTHIALAYPAVDYASAHYYTLRAGLGVLSDGMSSRLFDRVREQRGLCYSVWAGTHSLREIGGVFAYAGTTAERAQETFDVTMQEIQALREGVEEDELQRLKVRVQSNLIMEQESSLSRASSMASDYYYLGRVIPAHEIQARIEAVDSDAIARYWSEHPPSPLRVVTLGPQALDVRRYVGSAAG